MSSNETDSVSTQQEDEYASTATNTTSPSSRIIEERNWGVQSNPLKNRLEPTGHPPTYMSDEPSVSNFSGTLEELIEFCASAEPGTVVDLGGESVRGETQEFPGAARSLSSIDIDDEASDTDSDSTWPCEPATLRATRTVNASGPAGKKRRGIQPGPELSMLLQSSPPFLLAETPAAAESGPLEPTYSFTSIPIGGKDGFSGSFDSNTEELPDGSRLSSCTLEGFRGKRTNAGFSGPEATDSPGSATPTSGAAQAGSSARLLRQIASDASMRMRNNAENAASSTLLSSECVRRSCEFDSKGLDERLAPNASDAPISCIVLTGSNITIRNGTIILPAGCLMLLEQGVLTFQNCHVVGTGVRSSSARSLPLVYVLEASITMRECRVCRSDGHGIGVGSNGSLMMERCNVSDHATCGIVVRGAASSIDLEDCCLESNGQDGVAVSDGALARANNCMLSRNGMLGLGVSAAAKAFLNGCCIERNGTHGLAAHAAASLNATACSITGCEAAILALDPATVVHTTGCMLFKNEQGLHIRDGAQVYAVDTSIERHTIGALVTSTRSYLECTQSVIKHSRRAGMHVLGGARATLTSSTLATNGDTGCFVQHAHSTVLATEAVFTGNGTSGALVSVGASMHLYDCELTENRIAGAQSTDGDTTMVLRGCLLKKNGTIGVFANKGSSVTAASCTLTHNGSSGCEVRDRCTNLVATNCALSENGRVGLYVHSAGTMSMVSCTVIKNRSLAVLCGGRDGTDIGGGLVTHCTQTVLTGGTKMRHGGRMYKSCDVEEESECSETSAAAANTVAKGSLARTSSLTLAVKGVTPVCSSSGLIPSGPISLNAASGGVGDSPSRSSSATVSADLVGPPPVRNASYSSLLEGSQGVCPIYEHHASE